MIEYISVSGKKSERFGDIFGLTFHPPRQYPGICDPYEFILPFSVRSADSEAPVRHFGIRFEITERYKLCEVLSGYASEKMEDVRDLYRTWKAPGDNPVPEAIEFINVGGENDKRLAYLDVGEPASSHGGFASSIGGFLTRKDSLPVRIYVLGENEPREHKIEIRWGADDQHIQTLKDGIIKNIEDGNLDLCTSGVFTGDPQTGYAGHGQTGVLDIEGT